MSTTTDFIEAAAEFVKQTLRVILLGEEPKEEQKETETNQESTG